VHSLLREALHGPQFASYDFILIDCPPNFNIITKNAIVASDSILIPAKPDYLSTLGIDYLHRSVNELADEFNQVTKEAGRPSREQIGPEVLGVIFTMVQFYAGQPISAVRPFIEQTRRLGISVFDSQLRENKTLFADAPQYGVPVILESPSDSAQQRVVDELNAFVSEFEAKIGI